MKLEVHPLTADRWTDLVELFNCRGGSMVRGCWCMYYRKSGATVPSGGDRERRKRNKAALRALVSEGTVPGLLGYQGGRPVGWISLGPREDYAKLQRSPVMKPVDDRPVWSIVCFFTDPRARGQGVSEAMLKAATQYARKHGARLLESYPVDSEGRRQPDSMWFGSKAMFDRAGFKEVARRKPARPVMRKPLRAGSK
jgi:GNAT superfamily N-acetyltransferase